MNMAIKGWNEINNSLNDQDIRVLLILYAAKVAKIKGGGMYEDEITRAIHLTGICNKNREELMNTRLLLVKGGKKLCKKFLSVDGIFRESKK